MSDSEGEKVSAVAGVPDRLPSPGGVPGEEAHPVKRAATAALSVYRAVDKLDRWSGGGQTLALVVKIAGWVGLLCVLYALVVKLNDVARRLDPVTNGIAKLAGQLDASRKQLAAEDDERRASAQRLAAAAKSLDDGMEKLHGALAGVGGAETDAAKAAGEATQGFRAALERLRAEDEHVNQSQAQLLEALTQSQQALAQLRDSLGKESGELAKGGAQALQAASDAADAGLALAHSETQAGAQIEQAQRGLAQIDIQKLQAAVARATAAADELAHGLEQSKGHLAKPAAAPSSAMGSAH